MRFFRLPPTTIVGRFVLGERAPFAEALDAEALDAEALDAEAMDAEAMDAEAMAGGVERGVKNPEDELAPRGASIGVGARNPRFAFVKKDRGSHDTGAGFFFGAGSNILAIFYFSVILFIPLAVFE